MSHHSMPRGERIALTALFGLVVFSASVIFAGRLTGTGLQNAEVPPLVDQRTVYFLDADPGQVAMVDADTKETIAVFNSGEGGFARTALRALAYTRRLHDLGPEVPMIVGRASDGRLVIHDPATNKTISLDAFGDANAAQFAFLLDRKDTQQ